MSGSQDQAKVEVRLWSGQASGSGWEVQDKNRNDQKQEDKSMVHKPEVHSLHLSGLSLYRPVWVGPSF